MRVLLIGSSGTIGKAITAALSPSHEVVGACRNHADNHVDIRDPASIAALYRKVGKVDAVISAAGGAAWKPVAQLTDEDFRISLDYKLMGQVNVVRRGLEHVSDDGVLVITSGILAHHPSQNS